MDKNLKLISTFIYMTYIKNIIYCQDYFQAMLEDRHLNDIEPLLKDGSQSDIVFIS